MGNKILLTGKIIFDPIDITKKHENQSSWKYVAMVKLEGDLCEYYSWFLKKRYGLLLNKPLRGAHITFINDSFIDLSLNKTLTKSEVDIKWNKVKKKWDNVIVPIMLNVEPRTNGEHWWLNIPYEYRERLHSIRQELLLKKPFFGLHMTIGYPNDKNINHSHYLHTVLTNDKKY